MRTARTPRAETLVATLIVVGILAAFGMSWWHPGSPASRIADTERAEVENFDGPSGDAPNSALWGYQTGGGGWGNGELQHYTDDRTNSALDGAGHLVVTARKARPHAGGPRWTSARLTTQGRWSFTHGTLTARIQVPAGDGLWPAFWLLGDDIDDVGWPGCGEIDIVEVLNHAEQAHVGLHGPTADGRQWKLGTSALPRGGLAGRFVDYSVRREPGLVAFFVDGSEVGRFSRDDLSPEQTWVFDKPMFVLLNVAVGGKWPGPPSNATPDNASMLVDRISYEPLRARR